MKIDINEIKKIAKKAGDEILKYYKSDYKISYKAEKSPVTDADLESERIIKKELAKYGWPILSEESADDKSRLNSEHVWIVDPLDGTSDFMDKTDEFSVIIGLVYKNESVLGVVYEPVSEVIYFAEKDKGSYKEKNGNFEKLKTSGCDDIAEMNFLSSRFHQGELELKFREKFGIKNFYKVGSCGLKMVRISSGKGDLYINSSSKSWEWDTSAPQLILEEAGGIFTDLYGQNISYNNNDPRLLKGYIASNGKKHKEIVDALKDL